MKRHQTKEMKIAVMGATSHIAKGLICRFAGIEGVRLFLFARDIKPVRRFLKENGIAAGPSARLFEGYDRFMRHEYDAVINCVGLGTESGSKNIFTSFFLVTEKFDDLALAYLMKRPRALLINFSSGAVYHGDFTAPAGADTPHRVRVNAVTPDDYFSIVKMNSEAKHRAFKDLNIIDIRVFSYFSRFADLSVKYFMTELLRCVLENRTFVTDANNIVRDFIHPDDLFALVRLCLRLKKVNAALDAYSLRPVRKKEVLAYFASRHGLKYKIARAKKCHNVTGQKCVYYSVYRKAKTLGYRPRFSSLDTLRREADLFLKDCRGAAGCR